MTGGTPPQRLQVSPQLRRMMDYAKFKGDTPRVLVLGGQYWLDSACNRAALRLGWETAITPVVMEGAMSRDLIAGFLERLTAFRPDFVLTVNLGGMDEQGMFSALLADLQVPYVTWFVDDPRTIIMGRRCYASPWAVALTWEPAYGDYLRSVGFESVHTLPLAADTNIFDGAPLPGAVRPPSFVGSSMRAYAEREWSRLRERPALAKALEQAFLENSVDRLRFGDGMQTILGAPLWDSVDAEGQRQLELVCFIEGTRRLREELMQRLSPLSVIVRGDDGWKAISAACGPAVDYEKELPQWYRECAVNLNTTSIQMASALNQRVFDCPAAGGFLLTDAQSSLDALFDEGEMVRYCSLAECEDKLRFYTQRPEARQKIIRKAQARIRHAHTYEHRLRALKAILTERFSG